MCQWRARTHTHTHPAGACLIITVSRTCCCCCAQSSILFYLPRLASQTKFALSPLLFIFQFFSSRSAFSSLQKNISLNRAVLRVNTSKNQRNFRYPIPRPLTKFAIHYLFFQTSSMQHTMKPAIDNNTHSLNFLPKDTHDPLRHTTTDLFWYHVEPVSFYQTNKNKKYPRSAFFNLICKTAPSLHILKSANFFPSPQISNPLFLIPKKPHIIHSHVITHTPHFNPPTPSPSCLDSFSILCSKKISTIYPRATPIYRPFRRCRPALPSLKQTQPTRMSRHCSVFRSVNDSLPPYWTREKVMPMLPNPYDPV